MGYTTAAANVAMGVQGIEWIVLLLVLAILFIFGPKKIPELLRGLGRGMGEFKRGQQEIEKELKRDLAETAVEEERKEFEGRVVRAAKELSVDVEARSQREIKLDMVKVLEKATRERVVAAAKTLGVATEGLDLQRVREGIVKRLPIGMMILSLVGVNY